jgi:hypothetical protein
MTDPKQPKFYNLVGHGGEVVPDMLCCEGCGYGVCSCPADQPVDVEPYGCVNRTTDSPRECVESGHYYCDLSKKPAEPKLRAGWYILGQLNGQSQYKHESGHVVYFTYDGWWRVVDDGNHVVSTLEAAMQRAEELVGEP